MDNCYFSAHTMLLLIYYVNMHTVLWLHNSWMNKSTIRDSFIPAGSCLSRKSNLSVPDYVAW